jgi:hypothetical protein
MSDICCVLLIAGFGGLSFALLVLCDRLMGTKS